MRSALQERNKAFGPWYVPTLVIVMATVTYTQPPAPGTVLLDGPFLLSPPR